MEYLSRGGNQVAMGFTNHFTPKIQAFVDFLLFSHLKAYEYPWLSSIVVSATQASFWTTILAPNRHNLRQFIGTKNQLQVMDFKDNC